MRTGCLADDHGLLGSEAYKRFGTSIIGLQQVAPEKVERYGIVAGEEVEPGIVRITDLVEKPKKSAAPSNLAIAARYILTPAVFPCLDVVEPGKGGEIQLTDALRDLAREEKVVALEFEGERYDTGSKIGFLKATIDLALGREDLSSDLEVWLRERLKNHRGKAS